MRNEKNIEHESDSDANCNRWGRYSHQRIVTWIKELGNKRTRGEHSDYSIIKIGQNTENDPEDLRWLAVAHTPVEDHQLMLVWKTLKRV